MIVPMLRRAKSPTFDDVRCYSGWQRCARVCQCCRKCAANGTSRSGARRGPRPSARVDSRSEGAGTDSYELRWQSEGTLATYDVTTSPATLVWSPIMSQGTEVAFQSDGNFCIDNESTPIWCTRTADAQRNGKGGETLVLWESSGNLAIYNIDSVLLWQSEQSNSASDGTGSASEPAN